MAGTTLPRRTNRRTSTRLWHAPALDLLQAVIQEHRPAVVLTTSWLRFLVLEDAKVLFHRTGASWLAEALHPAVRPCRSPAGLVCKRRCLARTTQGRAALRDPRRRAEWYRPGFALARARCPPVRWPRLQAAGCRLQLLAHACRHARNRLAPWRALQRLSCGEGTNNCSSEYWTIAVRRRRPRARRTPKCGGSRQRKPRS